MMKIYLDNCCIQRPLDDRSQLRIAVEGEIILNIISLIEAGAISLLSSEISIYEAKKISNIFRREFTLKVLSERSEFTQLKHRSSIFTEFGIKPIDALHPASAEALKTDFFCTCDDNFLKKAKRIGDLEINAVSILELLQELENGNCSSNIE